jgi:UDP:flavonoid glycosyltransferase YjiC (YdhE family)
MSLNGDPAIMKLLFTAGGGQAAVFGAAPLATAARNAGHDILLALDEPLLGTAEAIGLPAVSISAELLRYGHELAMASARLEAMVDLAEAWSPDVVVGGLSYIPGLLATRLKVPYVRQAWVPTADMPARAARDLRLELDRLGMAELPDPDLFIDVCPPSLRPSSAPAPASGGQPMRWIPRNRQRRLEPWMYTRPHGRHRVLITSGTRTLMLGIPGRSVRQLLDQLALAGAEVLIAAPEGAAEKLGIELGDVRIGWIPLDVVAPTCDLVVHHGGATTAMTVMNAGVPHLIMPDNGYGAAVARAVAGSGAALLVTPPEQDSGADPASGQGPASGQDPAEAIAAGCREILGTPRYTEQARALAEEIAGLPTPAELVRTVEALAAP